jgi:putative LysE/RhtB family amino acid efflux pump
MTPLAVGFGLGFAVAAQVGPVTLLTVRSVIRGGLRIGLAMAVGVAIVDCVYAAAGAAGAGAALEVDALRLTLGVLGALVIAAIGARTLWAAFSLEVHAEQGEAVLSPRRALRTALAATASNPLTVISWAAVFAAASTAEVASSGSATALMVGGVLVGSFAWMAILAAGLTLLRRRIGVRGLRLLDAVSGTGILLFAVVLGARTLG